jgi:hypothetical protein
VSIEFVVSRDPRRVADEIEEIARAIGHVSALVVPWESTPTRLSIAVTSVKIDGWAIEHTSLGTIVVAADASGASRVSAVPQDVPGGAPQELATLFDRFAAQVQTRLKK